jgi:glycosyltransferase involved in cell wall biosynthesis
MSLTVGYLHVGAEEHGIHRYGRYLYREASRTPELTAIEECLFLDNGAELQGEKAQAIAERFAKCDVLHVQFNRTIWGGITASENFAQLCGRLTCPTVATVHDVYVASRWGHLLQSANRQLRRLPPLRPRGDEYRTLPRAAAILVCAHEEARRLQLLFPNAPIEVIPHFVETSPVLPASERAKRELGLTGRKVITLLGFIHKRKGHELLLEALALLPEDYVAVFLGGAVKGNEPYEENLRERAKSLGIGGRLRVTGYLREPELVAYQSATDLAVCPFERLSASGSLSTWIACRKPMLVSNLDQVRHYNQLSPGAIEVFSPYTAQALAQRIEQLATRSHDQQIRALGLLADKLSLPSVFREHLRVYQRVAKSEPS